MKSEVDHRDAFQLYYELGAERSANRLTQVLKERGFKIGRDTINKWRHEYEWDKRLPEMDAARELEREAVRIKHEAKQTLEEIGAKPAEDLRPIRAPTTLPTFSARESTANASERVNAMVSALAQTCMDHVGRIEDFLETPQLILLINATRDLARAAGDLHRAVIQQPSKGKDGAGGDIIDAKVIEQAPPGKAPMIPDDAEELIEALLNPPRLSGKI